MAKRHAQERPLHREPAPFDLKRRGLSQRSQRSRNTGPATASSAAESNAAATSSSAATSGPICVASRPGRASTKPLASSQSRKQVAARGEKSLRAKNVRCAPKAAASSAATAAMSPSVIGRMPAGSLASPPPPPSPCQRDRFEHRLEAERTINAFAGRRGVEHRHQAAPRNLGATRLQDARADAFAAAACGDQHHADPGEVVRIRKDGAAWRLDAPPDPAVRTRCRGA